MEAIAAFGFAASVINFIDFGFKLAKITWRVHSDQGSPQDISELEALINRIEKHADAVSVSLAGNASASTQAFKELAIDCRAFSIQLVEWLRKAGLLATTKGSKLETAKAVLRRILHKDELERWKELLSGYRDRLVLQLLDSLILLAAQSLDFQKHILSQLEISATSDSKLQSSMQAVLDHLTTQKDLSDGATWTELMGHELTKQIYHGHSLDDPKQPSPIVLDAKVSAMLQQDLLSALSYSEMGNRLDQVVGAFDNTFRWALETDSPEQKWQSLPGWLTGESPLYWISGKPGSGKSTLMKYLSHEEGSRCRQFLQRWANNDRVICATFYFWASDPGQLQRSRSGLLRTLLYQLLSASPEMIPQIFPTKWQALSIVGVRPEIAQWPETDLHQALLRSVAVLATKHVRICFFIDGLDEFEGDPDLIIPLIENISEQGSHVKLCVASRPWTEFSKAFSMKPQLRLEDLTHNDILYFVSQKLTLHPEFATVRMREAAFAEQLIQDIVHKSDGVFLWVDLVVSSLLSGMTRGDRIIDLQHRLDMLPPKLEELYDKILESLDEFDHQHRAQMILLMEASEQALSLLVFAFADEGSTTWYKSLPDKPMSLESIHMYLDVLKQRINSRWRGLIEVSRLLIDTGSGPTVQYLHKTVRDFVHGKKMSSYLEKSGNSTFDPHLQLCIAYAAQLKTRGNNVRPEDAALNIFKHARQVSNKNQAQMMQVLRHLNGLMYVSAYHREVLRAARKQHGLEQGFRQYVSDSTDVLNLSIVAGVTGYISSTLKQSLDDMTLNRLLHLCCSAAVGRVHYATICWLIHEAKNLNQTAWEAYIRHFEGISSLDEVPLEARLCIIAFVTHGADLDVMRTTKTLPQAGFYTFVKPSAWPESFYNELKLLHVVRKQKSSLSDYWNSLTTYFLS